MSIGPLVKAIFRRLCRRAPLDEEKQKALLRRELRAREQWQLGEKWLLCYADSLNPTACWWFRKREGRWVALRLLLLAGVTFVAAFGSIVLALAIPLACWLGADIVLANTALIFKRDPQPLSVMRSVIFSFASYFSMALAFAPFWLWLHEGFQGTPWERSLDAAWQSVRTLTTAGPDVALCYRKTKVLAAVESFIGIYFITIIVAGYVSWIQGRQRP